MHQFDICLCPDCHRIAAQSEDELHAVGQAMVNGCQRKRAEKPDAVARGVVKRARRAA